MLVCRCGWIFGSFHARVIRPTGETLQAESSPEARVSESVCDVCASHAAQHDVRGPLRSHMLRAGVAQIRQVEAFEQALARPKQDG